MVRGKQKRKPNKGFHRSKKEWEKSIAGHIGRFIDRIQVKDIPELIALAGVLYGGYEVTKDLRGPIIGVIGYKLATTMGGTPPVSQIAGLAILGTMGLTLLGAKTQYSVEIPGTGIHIPQAIPPPEQIIEAALKGEKKGWYIPA